MGEARFAATTTGEELASYAARLAVDGQSATARELGAVLSRASRKARRRALSRAEHVELLTLAHGFGMSVLEVREALELDDEG